MEGGPSAERKHLREMRTVRVADREIGSGHPCFLIAEAGVNHNGDPGLARRLVQEAAAAGADAVKFQTFVAERLASPATPKAAYQRRGTQDMESQLHMLAGLELSEQSHRELIAESHRRDILFLSSVFDEASGDMLERLGVPAFKVPSGELTNLPLLAYLARKGLPLLISTGMATLDEVQEAISVCRAAGNDALVLLHCVSSYPADPADANLRAMATMATACGVPVGYSDHTQGLHIALAAVASGACVLEKHVTLDRKLPGPDHRLSLEPPELRTLVNAVRDVERALGTGVKRPVPAEAAVAAVARKSLVAAVDIPVGTIVADHHLAIRRPGIGIPPSASARVLGRRARQHIPAGTVLSLEMLDT